MVTRLSLILAIIATIGLIALGATSLDTAVRRMGARGWQRLHNTIYLLTGLAIVHYLLSPDIYPEQYLMSGMFVWLIGWRVLNRRGLATDPGCWRCSRSVRRCSRRYLKPAGSGPITNTRRSDAPQQFQSRARASRRPGRCSGSGC